MKQCPKCSRTYDDSQSFCLMDGTSLVDESGAETVVKQQPAAPKKSRLLLWAGLTGLVVLIGAVGAAFLIYTFVKKDQAGQNKQVSKTNTSPSPTAVSTPKPTPTIAAANSSPTAANSSPSPVKPDPSGDDDEEITPISWSTSASVFKSEPGTIYKFRCPPNGTTGSIWGSDFYTQDSSICTAAVHAGLFSVEDGGVVTIEFRPGRQTYGSTERNGIKSNTFGEYPHSYVVR